MANKTIQVKSVDNLISRVSLELSMEINRKDEKSVRDAFDCLADEVQDQFERQDELDISREPRGEISEPTSVATILKAKQAKAIKKKPTKKAKLLPAKQAEAVEPEVNI